MQDVFLSSNIINYIKLFLYAVYILFCIRTLMVLLKKEVHGVMSYAWMLSTLFIPYIVYKIEIIAKGTMLLMPGAVFMQHKSADFWLRLAVYFSIAAILCNFSRAVCIIRELDKGVFKGIQDWEQKISNAGIFIRVTEKGLRFIAAIMFTLFFASLAKLAYTSNAWDRNMIEYTTELDRDVLNKFTTKTDVEAENYRLLIIPISVWGMVFYIINIFWSFVIFFRIIKDADIHRCLFQFSIGVSGFISLYSLTLYAGGGHLAKEFVFNIINSVKEHGVHAFFYAVNSGKQINNAPGDDIAFYLIAASLFVIVCSSISIAVCGVESLYILREVCSAIYRNFNVICSKISSRWRL